MRRAFVAVVVIVCAVALGSCGDSGSDDDIESQASVTTVDITIEGGTVTPNGERVQVEAGEPIELVIQADEPGELHIHSDPEQELEYGVGTTTLPLTIDQPGIVDVESHTLEKTIVQLEVE